MKNKPHPRWVGSGANAEIDKWHSRSKSAATESTEGSESYNCGPSLPSPAVQLSVDGAAGEAVTTAPPPLSIVPALSDTTLAGIPRSLINDANPGLTSLSTYYNIPSPFEPLSPALVTPTDKFSPSVGIVGDQQPITTDFDIASIFMAYPDLISADDTGVHHTSKHQVPDHAKVCPTRHYVTLQPEDEHCGCLNEPSSYQAVLELSLRLRKAADLLSRSAYHCMGTPCMLNERISELDAFTTYAILLLLCNTRTLTVINSRSVLGNVQCPPEISSSLMASSPSSRQTSSYSMASPAFASHHQPWFSVLANPGPSQSELHSLYSTQTLPVMAKNHDENFMSWQGPQRKQTAAMNPC